MLETGAIAGRLHRHLVEQGRRCAVEDVRIGGSYVAVVLTGGRIGLAARLKEAVGAEIEPSRASERISGRPADTLLDRLVYGTGAVERALGLATANALIHPPAPAEEEDTISLMSAPCRRAGRHGGSFPTHRAEDRVDGCTALHHRARYAGEREKEIPRGLRCGHCHGNDAIERDPRGDPQRIGQAPSRGAHRAVHAAMRRDLPGGAR